MSLVSIPGGLLFPDFGFTTHAHNNGLFTVNSANDMLMDAATEGCALMGRVYIDGRAASKTISAAGGGSISVRTGAVTFATVGSTLDIGLQGISASAGPMPQPDGTYTVKRTSVAGTDSISGSSWVTFSMSGGTGSKTVNHGDLVAVVFTLTALGAGDSIRIQGCDTAFASQIPCTNTLTTPGPAWSAARAQVPMAVITFDDGTIGTLDGSIPFSVPVNDSYASGTNPNERGMVFQVPWDCKIDALYASTGGSAATADFQIALYSTPTGTPAVVSGTQLTENAEQNFSQTGSIPRTIMYSLPAEVSLSRNTDYCVAVLATGAGSVRLHGCQLGDTSYRKFIPGGTTLFKATRNGSSGAFTEESPATTMYVCGVRISAVDDGTGRGSAPARVFTGF